MMTNYLEVQSTRDAVKTMLHLFKTSVGDGSLETCVSIMQKNHVLSGMGKSPPILCGGYQG